MDALFVRHETQVREDHKTGEEAGETVDGSSHEAVPVRTRTAQVLRRFPCSSFQICIHARIPSLKKSDYATLPPK